MILCGSPDAGLSRPVPAPVQIGGARYEVLPPETTRLAVARGRYVAIPLYDGTLGPLFGSKAVLRYLGIASVPKVAYIHTAAGTAASHRLALFHVIGDPGESASVLVRLRLRQLSETCESCRTVHFFVRVR